MEKRASKPVLKDDNLDFCYSADSIYFAEEILERDHINSMSVRLFAPSKYGPDEVVRNDEPFLVNEVNTWAIRDEIFIVIQFLPGIGLCRNSYQPGYHGRCK